MSYTKHTWVDNETITAAKMNNIENGIGAGCAIIELTASYYGSASQCYGYLVYGIYDSNNSMWKIYIDDNAFWQGVYGYASNAPRIIPLSLTALPNDDNVSLFFLVSGDATVSVTGDITATNLYYSWGSLIPDAYRITGDGSISLVAN